MWQDYRQSHLHTCGGSGSVPLSLGSVSIDQDPRQHTIFCSGQLYRYGCYVTKLRTGRWWKRTHQFLSCLPQEAAEAAQRRLEEQQREFIAMQEAVLKILKPGWRSHTQTEGGNSSAAASMDAAYREIKLAEATVNAGANILA